MKVTPEIVKKRLLRFYALFHSHDAEAFDQLWPLKESTWFDIFRDTEEEAFAAACTECERTLKRFPLPSDVMEQISAM